LNTSTKSCNGDRPFIFIEIPGTKPGDAWQLFNRLIMSQQPITDKINTAKDKCFVCFDCLVSSVLPGTDDLKAYREAEERLVVGAVDLLRFKTEEKDHQLND
jgi:hypothetical protein